MSISPPPPFDPAPTPGPVRGQKATFSDRLDALVTWWQNSPAQLSALCANVWNNAVEAYNAALSAASNATAAAASASAAALTANSQPFNPATNYQQYQAAISLVNFQVYRRRSAGTGTTDPANDPATWAPGVAPSSVVRMTRDTGSNAALTRGDSSKEVEVTSGTFTQAFDAAATLGAGWFVFYTSSGSGEVTLDPNGGELINGATTLLVQKGAFLLITCDGIGFIAKVLAGATGYMKVSDQKASGVNGGALTAGYNICTLNTTDLNTINGASLSSNQVSLPAGTYDLDALSVVRSDTNLAKLVVYNVTDSVYLGNGMSQAVGNTSPVNTVVVHHRGRVVLASAKVLELRRWVFSTVANTEAGGKPLSSGQPEVYSQFEIRKVA